MMKRKLFSARILVLLLTTVLLSTAILASCKKKQEPPSPESITITGKPDGNIVEFSLDQTLQLGAEITPADAQVRVNWSSSNEGIATVNENGLVVHKGIGQTEITASIEGTDLNDSFTLGLRGALNSITITGKPTNGTEFYANDVLSLGIAYEPSFVPSFNVEWSSSKPYATEIVAGADKTATVHIKEFVEDEVVITATVQGTSIKDSFNIKTKGPRSYTLNFDEATEIAWSHKGWGGGVNLALTEEANDLPENGTGKALKLSVDEGIYDGVTFTLPHSLVRNASYRLQFDIKALSLNPLEDSEGKAIPYRIYAHIGSNTSDNTVFCGNLQDTGTIDNPVAKTTHVNAILYATSDNINNVSFFIDTVEGARPEISISVDNLLLEYIPLTSLAIKAGATEIDSEHNVDITQKTLQLSATTNAGRYKINWSSSNTDAATVDQTGLVSLWAYPETKTTTITATVDGTNITKSFTLNVQNTEGWYPIDIRFTGELDNLIYLGKEPSPKNYEIITEKLFGVSHNASQLSYKLLLGTGEALDAEIASIDGNILTFKQACDAIRLELWFDIGGDAEPQLLDFKNFEILAGPTAVDIKIKTITTDLIDVSGDDNTITIEHTYTRGDYNKNKISYELYMGSVKLNASNDYVNFEVDSETKNLLITAKKLSYEKLKVVLLYDETTEFGSISSDHVYLTLIDTENGDSMASLAVSANETITTDQTKTPFGIPKATRVTFSTSGWKTFTTISYSFKAVKSYMVMFDVKALSPASGETAIGISHSSVQYCTFYLPKAGESRTLSLPLKLTSDTSEIRFGFELGAGAVLDFTIANVRIVELGNDAKAVVDASAKSLTLAEVGSGVGETGSSSFGTLADGEIFYTGSLFKNSAGLKTTVSGLTTGIKYTVSFDFMLNAFGKRYEAVPDTNKLRFVLGGQINDSIYATINEYGVFNHISVEITAVDDKLEIYSLAGAGLNVTNYAIAFIIKNITFTEIPLSTASITNKPSGEVELNTKYINLTTDVSAYYTKTFTSSDTSVALIDNTGKITLLKAGTTLITLNVMGHSATDSFTLTVTNTANWIPLELSVVGEDVPPNKLTPIDVEVENEDKAFAFELELVFGQEQSFDSDKLIFKMFDIASGTTSEISDLTDIITITEDSVAPDTGIYRFKVEFSKNLYALSYTDGKLVIYYENSALTQAGGLQELDTLFFKIYSAHIFEIRGADDRIIDIATDNTLTLTHTVKQSDLEYLTWTVQGEGVSYTVDDQTKNLELTFNEASLERIIVTLNYDDGNPSNDRSNSVWFVVKDSKVEIMPTSITSSNTASITITENVTSDTPFGLPTATRITINNTTASTWPTFNLNHDFEVGDYMLVFDVYTISNTSNTTHLFGAGNSGSGVLASRRFYLPAVGQSRTIAVSFQFTSAQTSMRFQAPHGTNIDFTLANVRIIKLGTTAEITFNNEQESLTSFTNNIVNGHGAGGAMPNGDIYYAGTETSGHGLKAKLPNKIGKGNLVSFSAEIKVLGYYGNTGALPSNEITIGLGGAVKGIKAQLDLVNPVFTTITLSGNDAITALTETDEFIIRADYVGDLTLSFIIRNIVIAVAEPQTPTITSDIDGAENTASAELNKRYVQFSSNLVTFVPEWSSSDSSKVRIDESTGKATLLAEGTVTITATATKGTNKTATFTLTVTNTANWYPLDISFSLEGLELAEGQDYDYLINLEEDEDEYSLIKNVVFDPLNKYNTDSANIKWVLDNGNLHITINDNVVSFLEADTYIIKLVYDAPDGERYELCSVKVLVIDVEPVTLGIEGYTTSLIDVENTDSITLSPDILTGVDQNLASHVSWKLELGGKSKILSTAGSSSDVIDSSIVTFSLDADKKLTINFFKASYEKLIITLIYNDGIVAPTNTKAVFTIVDSEKETIASARKAEYTSVSPIENTVDNPNAIETQAPYGVPNAVLVSSTNSSDLFFVDHTFTAGKKYAVIMDIKTVSNGGHGSVWATLDGYTGDKVNSFFVPAVGEVKTIAMTLDVTSDASSLKIHTSHVSGIQLSIANIRINEITDNTFKILVDGQETNATVSLSQDAFATGVTSDNMLIASATKSWGMLTIATGITVGQKYTVSYDLMLLDHSYQVNNVTVAGPGVWRNIFSDIYPGISTANLPNYTNKFVREEHTVTSANNGNIVIGSNGDTPAFLSFMIKNLSIELDLPTPTITVPGGTTLDLKTKTVQLSSSLGAFSPTWSIVSQDPANGVASIDAQTGLLTLKGAGTLTVKVDASSINRSATQEITITNTSNWYPLDIDVDIDADFDPHLGGGYLVDIANEQGQTEELTVDYSLDVLYDPLTHDSTKLIWVHGGTYTDKFETTDPDVQGKGTFTFKASGTYTVHLKYFDNSHMAEAQTIRTIVFYVSAGTELVEMTIAGYDTDIIDVKNNASKTLSLDFVSGEEDFDVGSLTWTLKLGNATLDGSDESVVSYSVDQTTGALTITANSASYEKLFVSFEYIDENFDDALTAYDFIFTLINSNDETLGTPVKATWTSVTSTTDTAKTPFGVPSASIIDSTDSWDLFTVAHTFVAGRKYAVMMDMKVISNSGSILLWTKLESQSSSSVHAPVVGASKTVLITYSAISNASFVYFGNSAQTAINFAVSNIRIFEITGNTFDVSSNGQNQITNLAVASSINAVGVVGDTLIASVANDSWGGFSATLPSNIVLGKKYTISFDFMLLSMSDNDGANSINFNIMGASNVVMTSSAQPPLGKFTRLTYETESATNVFSIVPHTRSQGLPHLSFMIKNIVFTEIPLDSAQITNKPSGDVELNTKYYDLTTDVPVNFTKTFTSSDIDVATVDNAGRITLIGTGTADITLNVTGYPLATDSFTLTVTNTANWYPLDLSIVGEDVSENKLDEVVAVDLTEGNDTFELFLSLNFGSAPNIDKLVWKVFNTATNAELSSNDASLVSITTTSYLGANNEIFKVDVVFDDGLNALTYEGLTLKLYYNKSPDSTPDLQELDSLKFGLDVQPEFGIVGYTSQTSIVDVKGGDTEIVLTPSVLASELDYVDWTVSTNDDGVVEYEINPTSKHLKLTFKKSSYEKVFVTLNYDDQNGSTQDETVCFTVVNSNQEKYTLSSTTNTDSLYMATGGSGSPLSMIETTDVEKTPYGVPKAQLFSVVNGASEYGAFRFWFSSVSGTRYALIFDLKLLSISGANSLYTSIGDKTYSLYLPTTIGESRTYSVSHTATATSTSDANARFSFYSNNRNFSISIANVRLIELTTYNTSIEVEDGTASFVFDNEISSTKLSTYGRMPNGEIFYEGSGYTGGWQGLKGYIDNVSNLSVYEVYNVSMDFMLFAFDGPGTDTAELKIQMLNNANMTSTTGIDLNLRSVFQKLSFDVTAGTNTWDILVQMNGGGGGIGTAFGFIIRNIVITKKPIAYQELSFLGISDMTGGGVTDLTRQEALTLVPEYTQMLGFETFRLWFNIASLVNINGTDVTANLTNIATLREQVNALMDAGVTNIIAVSYQVPYPAPYQAKIDYPNGTNDWMGAFPDPQTEKAEYDAMLLLIEKAYEIASRAIPEIRYWEPGNETNVDQYCHKSGWLYAGSNRENFVFTMAEKAQIITDICFYANRGIKAGNPDALLVMPGLVFQYDWENGDAGARGTVQILEMIYSNIESGSYPSGGGAGVQTAPRDYFDILNWHPYYNSGMGGGTTLDNRYVENNHLVYAVAEAHDDGDVDVIFTEIGYTTFFNASTDSSAREVKEYNQRGYIVEDIEYILANMPYVKSVIFFRLFDVEDQNPDSGVGHFNLDANSIERGFGLFTSPYTVTTDMELDEATFSGTGIRPKALTLALATYLNIDSALIGTPQTQDGFYKNFVYST